MERPDDKDDGGPATLDDVRLTMPIVEKSGRSTSRLMTSGPFLKGRIPWWWLARASLLGGRALAVALLVRFASDLRRGRPAVLTKRYWTPLGMNRHSAHRALQALRAAGLISVRSRPGQSPRVRVLERPTDADIAFAFHATNEEETEDDDEDETDSGNRA